MSNELKKTIMDFVAGYPFANLITIGDDGTPREG